MKKEIFKNYWWMNTPVALFVAMTLLFSCQDEEVKKSTIIHESVEGDDGIEIFSDVEFESEDNLVEGRTAALPELKSTIRQLNLRLSAPRGTTGVIRLRLVRVSDKAVIVTSTMNASALLRRSECEDIGRFVYWNINRNLPAGIQYRLEVNFTPDEQGGYIEWAYDDSASNPPYDYGNAVLVASPNLVVQLPSIDLRFNALITHADGEPQDQGHNTHVCWRRVSGVISLGQEFTLPADFENEILETAVLHTLDHLEGSGEHVITLAKLNSIEWLYTPDLVTTLEGTNIQEILYLPNLTSLTLNYVSGVDLTPVGDLTKLTFLKTRNMPSHGAPLNVAALGKLTTLTDLELEDCLISNISWISTLTNLTSLYLPNSRITNLAPLTSLTNLLYLNLSKNTTIVNISPLTSMTKLKLLNLSNNAITTLTGLGSLTNLEDLYLSNNRIVNLSPISGLTTALRNLSLDNNLITSVIPIHSLTQLNWVSLVGNTSLTLAQVNALRTALGTDTSVLWE